MLRVGALLLAHGAVQVEDLALVVLQRRLDLKDLEIDLIDELLGVATEGLELRLSCHDGRLQAALQDLHVLRGLDGVHLEVLAQRLLGVLGQLGTEVSREGYAIVVLHVRLFQGVDASSVIGEDLCNIAMMGLLLLTHAPNSVRELLKARERSQWPVIAVTEPLSFSRPVRFRA